MGIFSSRPSKGKISQRKRKSSFGMIGSSEKQGHVSSSNESHSKRKTSRQITRRR